CVHAFSLPFVRPRPPTSTLFPYTTLFRSTIRVATRSLGGVGARLGEEPLTSMLGENAQPGLPGSWLHFEGQAGSIVRLRVTSSEDRKSTRLNSSHVKNSYAVFCLKKKNNK